MSKGYKQCILVRKTDGGEIRETSYIPERFAVVGNCIRIKNEDDTWTDGWVVKHVGHYTDAPPDWKKNIRKHRQNTGDSLPKN